MSNKLWEKYESGKRYNNSFKEDYYSSVKTHNDFYIGNQWQGIDSNNNLPHPTFNIAKRIIDFKTASICGNKIAVQIQPLQNVSLEQDSYSLTDIVDAEIENIMEKNRLDDLIRDLLTDGATSGDMCTHIIFNPDNELTRNVKGSIEIELVDCTNVIFGNPNIKDVDKQPWVAIVGRDLVENLKAEQKELKGKGEIVKDSETLYQASDYKEDIESDSEGKALYIYLYERDSKTGTIKASKGTQDAIIFENIDTQRIRYPVAFENWYSNKNSYHGRGEMEGIIPNQIYLNKAMAMAQYHTMQSSFPLTLFNTNKIEALSNKIGGAVGIALDESKGETFNNVIRNLEPVNMSSHIINIIELCMQYTKECMGISDASLGNIDPKNTSAIIAVQRSNAIPLENVKSNLYNIIEQMVLIMVEMMGVNYGIRPVFMKTETGYEEVMFDFDTLNNIDTKINIDIGTGSYYSEIALIQTLDNLLMNGQITLLQYLERIPDELITKKQELINDIKELQAGQQEGQQQQYEQMAQFVESLPPEEQQRLQSLAPEEMEKEVLRMMGGAV